MDQVVHTKPEGVIAYVLDVSSLGDMRHVGHMFRSLKLVHWLRRTRALAITWLLESRQVQRWGTPRGTAQAKVRRVLATVTTLPQQRAVDLANSSQTLRVSSAQLAA